MEITALFQNLRFECEERSIEIPSPNNDKYRDEIEKMELRIAEIHIQQLKAYQDAEEIFLC